MSDYPPEINAAERGNVSMQASAELIMERDELREQLLEAQAAMKLHNDINGDVCQIKADLYALENHDEEVRKPLVEALKLVRKKIRIHSVTITERVATATQIIDDSLAKV